MAMATSSSYPPPPPYYRLYKEYEKDPSSAPEPPPPIDGSYQLFGATYTTDVVLPSLEDQGVRQLYPKSQNIDFKKELRTLNRELQLHILELADILVERPSQYARRVEDISLIFKNLHHLLNSLRPHQARATLIHMLESQIQRRKQAIEDIKQRREEAQKLLGESLHTLDGSQPGIGKAMLQYPSSHTQPSPTVSSIQDGFPQAPSSMHVAPSLEQAHLRLVGQSSKIVVDPSDQPLEFNSRKAPGMAVHKTANFNYTIMG